MIYQLENDTLKIEVNTKGAELWSLKDKRTNTQHLWDGNPAVWPRRSPLLFPICGKLAEDSYTVNGTSYALPQHGFVRDMAHTLVHTSEDALCFLVTSTEETSASYPYPFTLETTYQLAGNKLHYKVALTNTGGSVMPFGLGFHTGFTCPFAPDKQLEDYSLVFEKKETAIELVQSGAYITGDERVYLADQNEIPLRHDLFPSSFILKNLTSDYVGIVEKTSGRELRVWIQGFPYVTFWSTPGRVPYVCIEPWHGLPDPVGGNVDFSKKPGNNQLEPGKQFMCEQGIEIIL